jgi:hypothetical protein
MHRFVKIGVYIVVSKTMGQSNSFPSISSSSKLNPSFDHLQILNLILFYSKGEPLDVSQAVRHGYLIEYLLRDSSY